MKTDGYKPYLILSFLILISAMPHFPDEARGAEAVSLAAGGKSGYKIVIPDNAGEAEKYAAQELRDHLEKISGARLEIVSESRSGREKLILIGNTSLGARIVPESELAGRDIERFVVRAAGGNVAIRGSGPRGTLYGVYSLLENRLGVRWYTPEFTRIPKTAEITLDGLDYSGGPAFEYREAFFFHAFDGDFAARNRLNGFHHRLERKHGGKVEYINRFVHSFRDLIPPDIYFKDHPEYYTEINGERFPDRQLCLTNPDVLRIVTERVLEYAESAGGRRGIITVSQMDNVFPCMCEKCRKAYKQDGTRVDTYIRFVNSVADAIAEKHPGLYISTLAYNFTEEPPRVVRPRQNVIIRLCHMSPSCDLHPLDKCILNERFVKHLKGWSELTDNIYIWHYITAFHNYLMPYPNLNAIVSDFDFYKKNSVKGIFAQGNGDDHGGDVAELKAWLVAKLLWNPAADAEALIDEFITDYYGPAAPAMKKHIEVQRKRARLPNIHASLYCHPNAGYMNGPLLEKMDAALSAAENLAASDPVFFDRVRRERLAYLYVQIAAPEIFNPDHFSPGDLPGRQRLFDHFADEIGYFNINRLHELEPLEVSIERLKNRFVNRK